MCRYIISVTGMVDRLTIKLQCKAWMSHATSAAAQSVCRGNPGGEGGSGEPAAINCPAL